MNPNRKSKASYIPVREPTPENITKSVFGISVEDLIQDIIRNPGGKYNRLYEDKGLKLVESRCNP